MLSKSIGLGNKVQSVKRGGGNLAVNIMERGWVSH